MEVRNNSENEQLLTPESVESTRVVGDSVDPGVPNLEGSSPLPSNYLKASDNKSIISLNSPFLKVDTAETNEIGAADQLPLSGSVGSSTPKVWFHGLKCLCDRIKLKCGGDIPLPFIALEF